MRFVVIPRRGAECAEFFVINDSITWKNMKIFQIGIISLIMAGVLNAASVSDYNIVWDSPSLDTDGTMPLGNGDISANAWFDLNGDINFYIGKTDAWSDNARLLKVGKVRVKCEPSIFEPGTKFKQTLDLETGSITIKTSNTEHRTSNIELFIDANHPVINVSYESSVPVKMTAYIELWRTNQYTLAKLECSDVMLDRSKPNQMYAPTVVEPDTIIQDMKDAVGWYHHNIKSVGPEIHAKTQGVTGYKREDPLLYRTFGAIITGSDATRIDDVTLCTKPAKSGHISVHVLTTHPSSPDSWMKEALELGAKTEESSFKKRQKAHEVWWNEFWDRSWIHARQDNGGNLSEEDDAFIDNFRQG